MGRASPATGGVLIPRELGNDTHRKQCIAHFVAQETYFMLGVAFIFESSLRRENLKVVPTMGTKLINWGKEQWKTETRDEAEGR